MLVRLSASTDALKYGIPNEKLFFLLPVDSQKISNLAGLEAILLNPKSNYSLVRLTVPAKNTRKSENEGKMSEKTPEESFDNSKWFENIEMSSREGKKEEEEIIVVMSSNFWTSNKESLSTKRQKSKHLMSIQGELFMNATFTHPLHEIKEPVALDPNEEEEAKEEGKEEATTPKRTKKGLYEGEFPVILSDQVTLGDSFGLKPLCPAFSLDDFVMAEELNLRIRPLINGRGEFSYAAPSFLRSHLLREAREIIEPKVRIFEFPPNFPAKTYKQNQIWTKDGKEPVHIL